MLNRIILFALFTIAMSSTISAQELNCKLSIDYRSVQGTNTQIFQTLENALNEFINARQWTQQTYKEREKIECTMLLNVSKLQNNTNFTSTLTIQARRPIYNSNYNSSLINFIDKDVSFSYTEFETLEYNENSFTSNLTSVIAYWAYIIIALDNDSYALLNGTPIFQQAERIVSNAQGKDQIGWEPNQSSGQRNRYWLTEQMLHPDFQNLRKFSYTYHRLGLDMMANQPAEGRKAITDNLETLRVVHERRPSAFATQIFFDAKVDEIINIYTPTPFDEKDKAFEILNLIDPGHSQQYQKMNGGI